MSRFYNSVATSNIRSQNIRINSSISYIYCSWNIY